jgi:hypothetical protein
VKAKTKRKPPKLSQMDARFLADQIEAVAIIMWGLAEQMEYYGKNRNAEIVKHALQMAGASNTMRSWVDALMKECMK